jgi:signal transduction histidine kinase
VTSRLGRFRDLPLFYKLLVPFLLLMLVTGSVGALLIVHDQSTRAQAAVDESLSRRAVDTLSLMHDRELYLVESVSLAANLQGMSAAAAAKDGAQVDHLLTSVAALKQDLSSVVVTDDKGYPIGAYSRLRGTSSTVEPQLVAAALRRPAARAALLTRLDGHVVLAVAVAICADTPCRPTAAAVAAVDVTQLARRIAPPGPGGGSSTVTLFSAAGAPVAAAGSVRLASAPSVSSDIRRTQRTNIGEAATLYTPLVVQGQRVGTLGISIPTGSVSASVRSAALRFAAILFLAMVGVLAIGAYLSRSILRQVHPLVDTSRRLGAGDLTARAPVLGRDELGELAAGVNEMATELEASYATLEQRVIERTADVEQLLRERTDFFTGISHDFRTPLAVVLSQADMLLDPDIPKSPELARDAGRTVKESVTQLLARINDVLEIARAESGSLEIHLEPVRIDRVLGSLADTARTLELTSGVAVTFDVARSLAVVADEARLGQVVLNLLDNAVKYTPRGGEVRVTARADGDSVALRVADTGCGIPAEVGDRVFEPFYRVKGSKPQRQSPSSGLGLALTRRLVEAQQGEIRWEPNDDGGTTFVVTLQRVPAPRQRQSSGPDPATRTPRGAR